MPDAPAPHYGEDGQLLLPWLITVRYDPAVSGIVLTWQRDGSLWRKSVHGVTGYMDTEVPDVLEGIATTIYSLHKPSLF